MAGRQSHAYRLREAHRHDREDHEERTMQNNLRIFREALIRCGTAPDQIEALEHELETRMRGKSCKQH